VGGTLTVSINLWRQRSYSKSNLLLVEGLDEVNVFSSILVALGREDVDVINVGGKNKLAAEFVNVIKHSNFRNVRTFAIVQDADEDPSAAFDRVKKVLLDNKFVPPKTPGSFSTSERHKIGALILPGGNRGGYLEDLFLDSQEGTAGKGCVESFAKCCEAAGFTPFDSKRRAHAFMAALDAPEPRLGRAFDCGKLNGDHGAYNVIREFLALLT
jgi:hypothetical protein